MLIDVNTFVGHWPFYNLPYNTCSDLLESMNKFGVDLAVVTNINGIFYKNTQSANEELYNELKSKRSFRNRLIPFAVINPTYPDWKYDFEICYRKLGMMGVRIYPQYHDYNITDSRCVELVKMARDRDIPVAITLRIVDKRQRSWLDIDGGLSWMDIASLVKKVPDAKYMFMNKYRAFSIRNEPSESDNKTDTYHGGLRGDSRITDEAINDFKKSNIVFDTGGKGTTKLLQLIELFGKTKFAFGSHFPFLDCLCGRLRIDTLKEEEADEATKELFRSGNAKRIIGL